MKSICHTLGIIQDILPMNQEYEYYKCEICQWCFKEPPCQMEHNKAMHRFCAQCSREFLNEAELRKHKAYINKC